MFSAVVAACALVALAPVILVVAGLVRVKLGAPVLFKQVRPGLHGVPFEMVKFRTMTIDRDVSGKLLPDAVRLTAFGRMLRSSSLDELPELWNVLRGEMNLVGPRPLLVEYMPLYDDRQARRHDVRPGITGWAQVRGRNSLAWEEKFDLDVWYVEHRSFALDVQIHDLTTLFHVVGRHGIERRRWRPPFRSLRVRHPPIGHE